MQTHIEKQSLRTSIGIENPGEKAIALHVGHIKRGRNLEALRRLAESSREVSVLIVGSSSSRVDQRLLKRLRDSGCQVITGYRPDIEQIYNAADCYVFPTLSARHAIQIPLSVLEAMACGIPVVSTPFGGLPDLLSPGSGIQYLVSLEPQHLDRAILEAIRAPSEARRSVLHMGWDDVVRQHWELYRKLVGESLAP